ncbi:alkaline phosphatase family protein [Kineosporia babensis]|uniref:Alkaline phosphatase family protein n=1 Tax=Kineosporia babensis TaxID=499548 RepID=A0A9X1NKU9_9ACTN|nr:alkaline phosphatase family protein [Kineosporia babensis]MCD5314958.1 alkaline phosphatase family protein [Kineosporia babensis]
MNTRKILLVGIDGLRVDEALAGAAPFLAKFRHQGSLARIRMEVPTISGPGWSSLLHGVPHAHHGVFDNSFVGHRLHHSADLLARAHALNPRTTTFAAAGWPPLVDPLSPGPVIGARPDQQRHGLHQIVVRDGEVYGYRWADHEIAAAARHAVAQGPDVSFVYLGEVDEASHLHGATSAENAAAVLRVDAHLENIAAAVTARAEKHAEDWLVALTTDHGHVDEGGHGGSEDIVTASFLLCVRIGSSAQTALPETISAHDVQAILLNHLTTP